MEFMGFGADDFAAFEAPDFAGRMALLRERVKPKLIQIGGDLERRPGQDIAAPERLTLVGEQPEVAVVAISQGGDGNAAAVAAYIDRRDGLGRQDSVLGQHCGERAETGLPPARKAARRTP